MSIPVISPLKKTFILLSLHICLAHLCTNLLHAQKRKDPLLLELPAIKPGETITFHTGFALCYQEPYEQPSWVAYELTANETVSVTVRTNKFLPDPTIRTGSATQSDYANSGYDRGHLAPAADMGWSLKTMQESFYFSNMSPQLPTFNRGIWKKTEEQVRNWAREYGSLYIATGPVLEKDLPSIGPNKVAIPNYYYKALLRCLPSDTNAIAILIPHATSSLPIDHFFVSIDSLEKITGIDFFHNLTDDIERKIEKKCSADEWPLVKNNALPAAPSSEKKQYKSNVSVQCSGKTKSGLRCKRRTINVNGRCYSHQ